MAEHCTHTPIVWPLESSGEPISHWRHCLFEERGAHDRSRELEETAALGSFGILRAEGAAQ